MNKLKTLFNEHTPFKVFLLSVLITGVSYGLCKGMLDNFMAEIVGMGEADRGVPNSSVSNACLYPRGILYALGGNDV